MVTRADVVAEARGWIDVRFRHQGRTRHGVDCVGLVTEVAKSLGLSGYDFTSYSSVPSTDQALFLHHFSDNCREVVPWTAARPGDILVFNQSVYPCHVGILTDRDGIPSVVHSLLNYRRVRETPLDHEWEKAVRFAFEFPNLED